MSTLRHLQTTPNLAAHDHSWFILTQAIIEKEFALSGSEQNGDIVGRLAARAADAIGQGASPEVEAFKRKGADFVVAGDPTP